MCILQGTFCDTGIPHNFYGEKICSVVFIILGTYNWYLLTALWGWISSTFLEYLWQKEVTSKEFVHISCQNSIWPSPKLHSNRYLNVSVSQIGHFITISVKVLVKKSLCAKSQKGSSRNYVISVWEEGGYIYQFGCGILKMVGLKK